MQEITSDCPTPPYFIRFLSITCVSWELSLTNFPPTPIDLIESEKASLSVCVHSPVMLETS